MKIVAFILDTSVLVVVYYVYKRNEKEGSSMVANDTARLLMELEVIANTLISDEDVVKLKLRFEEVTNNYNVDRKTIEEMDNDLWSKSASFSYAIMKGSGVTRM